MHMRVGIPRMCAHGHGTSSRHRSQTVARGNEERELSERKATFSITAKQIAGVYLGFHIAKLSDHAISQDDITLVFKRR